MHRLALVETSLQPADAARAKLAEREISKTDVADAIRWARSTRQPPR